MYKRSSTCCGDLNGFHFHSSKTYMYHHIKYNYVSSRSMKQE